MMVPIKMESALPILPLNYSLNSLSNAKALLRPIALHIKILKKDCQIQ